MKNKDKVFDREASFDALEKLIASELSDIGDLNSDWDDGWNDDDSYDQDSSKETTWDNTIATIANENSNSTREKPRAADLDTSTAMESIDGGDGFCLHLHGKIDFGSRQQIAHLISIIRTGTAHHYDLDLSQVTAITLTGTSLLSLLIDVIAERKVEITFSNCQPPVYERLCWTGINKLVLVAQL